MCIRDSVSSVALYTWMQKKDRDGAQSVLAGLRSKESQKMLRFAGVIIAVLIALLALGSGLATETTPSG